MFNILRLLEKWGYEKREILGAYAKISIGKDLNKGIVDPIYACAVVVNAICNNALGFPVGGNASTYLMEKALRRNPRWRRVKMEEAQAGDLIIAATGFKNGWSAITNGHVGFLGDAVGDDIYPTKLISNNSATGLVDTHFTLASFYERYTIKGKYPTHIYRLIF